VQNYHYDLPMLITILEDEGALDGFVRDLFHFEIICERNFEFEDTFFNPLRSAEERLGLLDDLVIYFGDSFYRFLKQLIINDDIVHYERIHDKLLASLSAMQNCLYAKATTAIPLSDSQLGRIAAKLEELFSKQVFVYNNVSRYFSAGLLIQCGDWMIDLGGRTALDQLGKKLRA